MFLTTTGSAGSSISVLSSVLAPSTISNKSSSTTTTSNKKSDKAAVASSSSSSKGKTTTANKSSTTTTTTNNSPATIRGKFSSKGKGQTTKSSQPQEEESQTSSTSTSISSSRKGSNNSNTATNQRARAIRTNTSTSATSGTSSSTTNSQPLSESSASVLSTPASSAITSPATNSPPVICEEKNNNQYFPEQVTTGNTGSDTTTTTTTIPKDTTESVVQQQKQQSLSNTHSRQGSVVESLKSSASLSSSSSSSSVKQQNSMRRRATETIGVNLIPNSLRAVFRDSSSSSNNNNNNSTTNNTEQLTTNTTTPATATTTTEQNQQHSTTGLTTNTSTSHTGENSTTIGNPLIQLTSDQSSSLPNPGINSNAPEMPSIKFIQHQDQRTSRPSLAFAPMTRTLPDETSIIRVGRYSERDLSPNANVTPSAAPIGFKSKVVSRKHCEFWCNGGQWFVKDVKSSSGTFLNHIRLSQPSTESKPFPINDGDIVQLGMDFRGGEESIFRCVKIRIEVNRGWQKKLNEYNTSTHKALRALSKDAGPTSSTECSICLMSVAPCQALFVAPCSHVWHYKCIRPVINNPKMYPQFLCPNCRAVADLEADIDEAVDGWDENEELPDHDGTSENEPPNRVGTPINSNPNGDAVEPINEDTAMDTRPDEPAPETQNQATSNNDSGISSEELQDTTAILFSETSRIELRDPRIVPDSLEGVVTPRNEAGPFVFDGTGRRVQAPQTSAQSVPSTV